MAMTGTPAKTGLKYTYRDGEGYREWYKANTGADWDGNYLSAKPEGMSDVDWMQGTMIQQYEANKGAATEQKAQAGQQLTDIYRQQTSSAQDSYKALASQYGQQMKSELEYAGVLHERMKKYLPQQMAAQGMGNMGVAQTAGANAVAKHMSNRSAIIGQHQTSMNELNRTHSERQAALDAGYKQDMMAVDQTYNDRVTQLNDQRYADDMALFGQTVEEKAAEQEQYYLAGASGIANATTREEALALAEQMKPYVSEAQYQSLLVEANNRGNELDGIADVDQETGYDETEVRILDLIEGAMTRKEAQAWVDAAIADGSLPEDRRTYLEGKIVNKFGAENKADREEAANKASGQLASMFEAGTDSATLRATLDGMIAAGTIPESDRAYWEAIIANKVRMEAEEKEGKVTAQQTQSAAEAETLLLQATTPEQRAQVLATYQGAVSESQYRYLESLVGIADGNQKAEDATASQNKAIEQLSSLFAAGTSAAKLKETLDGMIAAGTIPESDRSYWETMIGNVEKMEADEAAGKIEKEQLQAKEDAQSLILAAADAETRAEELAKAKGKVSDSQYEYLESLVNVLDGNQQKEDTTASQNKAAGQLRDLFSAGTDSAKLKETLEGMIAAGTIPEGDRAYWEGLISAVETVEQEAAADEKAKGQLQEMTYAQDLILKAVDAAARAEQLTACRGKVSDAQYSYLERLVSVLDGNQSASDKQAGYDQADTDLRTLYQAGATSADLQTQFDSLKKDGKIEPGREQFWQNMISLREREETEIDQGKISVEQADNANFALTILGDALDPEDRADILDGCATWLETGRITQTQYDMIAQYCGVLDGNAEYLNQQEKDAEAEQDHAIFYENTLTYIAFAAVDYDDALRYANGRRDKFSDAEWDSIQTQLAARKKADDDANLAKQDAAQDEAEARFLDQMSLYASSSDATAKIEALLESFKDKLHPDVYDAWKWYVDDLKDSPLQQYNESLAGKDEDMAQKELDAQAKGYESWADYDTAVLMGREPVYEKFYITGEPIADADVPEIVTNKIKHDGFNGPYDPNHTTKWVEVGTNKYVVWYEGEWYWATGPKSTQKTDEMVGIIQDHYGIQ